MINKIIELILKEARIDKFALLQEQQINNMVSQFLAKNKIKEKSRFFEDKENYLKYAKEFNEIIKKVKVDFKNEKLLLIWLLQQVHKDHIFSDKIEEDSKNIEETLNLYFKNKHEIGKDLYKSNYSDVKTWVKCYKDGQEEAKHQEFLSKPVAEGKSYKIYKVTEIDQCIKIGKGTSWCIQGEKWAKHYLEKGPLYLITKNDKRFALIQFASLSFMDVNDNKLSDDVVKNIFEVWPESQKILETYLDEDYTLLRFISNPSEELQLKAVKQYGRAIALIKDPSEQVQLEAIETYALSIRYIKSPSEKAQLKAVNKNINAIVDIKEPSEAVQIAAVTQNPKVIKYILHPTDKVYKLSQELFEKHKRNV